MKFLVIILALAIASASGFELSKGELKSRHIVVPAGRPDGRITHGRKAAVGQIPYQVFLFFLKPNGDGMRCGGSLLNNRKVLTAAHCTESMEKVLVHLGATNTERAEIVYMVPRKDFIIHPGWNPEAFLNDIAIIDIPYTPYSKNIQPAKLPSTDFYSSYIQANVVASGWGSVSDYFNEFTTDLHFAHMTVMPNNMCRNFYAGVADSNICIYTHRGVSTCSGDSGGPLVLESTGEQIGLTSFGAADGCEKGIPTVFTRLTSFLDWIKSNAGVLN